MNRLSAMKTSALESAIGLIIQIHLSCSKELSVEQEMEREG